ncbi:MAG: YraN family protein [Thermoanaerobaculales bacterium]|nr:YraN family protein [Thermoanaerobaculales bacterium]
MPVRSPHRLGRAAEWLALLLLLAKGHRLRHRNWRGGGGEIDLVTSQRGETVFVEVKARTSTDFGGAAAAFGEAKRRVLLRASAAYLSRYGLWERPCRYDLVTIERGSGLLPWRLRHYRDVYRPDLGRRF